MLKIRSHSETDFQTGDRLTVAEQSPEPATHHPAAATLALKMASLERRKPHRSLRIGEEILADPGGAGLDAAVGEPPEPTHEVAMRQQWRDLRRSPVWPIHHTWFPGKAATIYDRKLNDHEHYVGTPLLDWPSAVGL